MLNRRDFSSTVPTTHLVTWKNEILYVVETWGDSIGPTPTKRSATPRDWPGATEKFETSQITDISGEHWGNKKGSILSLALKCHCSSLNWVSSNKFKPLLQNSVFIWIETRENSRISFLSKCGLRGISEKMVFPQVESPLDPRANTIPLGGTGNGGGFWVVKTSERCQKTGAWELNGLYCKRQSSKHIIFPSKVSRRPPVEKYFKYLPPTYHSSMETSIWKSQNWTYGPDFSQTKGKSTKFSL